MTRPALHRDLRLEKSARRILEREAREEERKHWEELQRLAGAGQVRDFYAYYACYLENHNVISDYRHVLHAMAVAVVRHLDCSDDKKTANAH